MSTLEAAADKHNDILIFRTFCQSK